MKAKKFIGVLALSLAVVLSGCTGKTATESTKAEKHLDTAIYWFGEDLDPANGWNAWTLSRIGVGENLATVDKDMQIVPQIADSWENISPTQWKFHIREGVKFSNGNPVTAEAVKSSLERVIGKDERAKDNAKMKSITVEGDYVVFETTEPYGSLVANLTEPLFSIIDTTQPEDSIKTMPVSTGPYAVKEYVPNVEVQLVANEHYWNGKPGLDTVTVKYIKDDATRALTLKSGEIQEAQRLNAASIAEFEGNPDYQVLTAPSLRVHYVVLNHQNEFLKDKAVREAMAFAADRENLAKIVRGEAAGAAFPSSAGYGYDKINKQTFDLEKAKTILKEAGYADTNGDGIVEKDGKEVALVLSIPDATPIAEAFQANMKEAGIKIDIEIKENINEQIEKDSFDLFLLNYVTATTGDSKRFMEQNYSTNGTDNFGKYSNPEFDAIVNKLVSEFDQAKRVELTIEGQQILNADVANIYLATDFTNIVASKNVKNIVVFPIDYYYLTKDITVE